MFFIILPFLCLALFSFKSVIEFFLIFVLKSTCCSSKFGASSKFFNYIVWFPSGSLDTKANDTRIKMGIVDISWVHWESFFHVHSPNKYRLNIYVPDPVSRDLVVDKNQQMGLPW